MCEQWDTHRHRHTLTNVYMDGVMDTQAHPSQLLPFSNREIHGTGLFEIPLLFLLAALPSRGKRRKILLNSFFLRECLKCSQR